MHESPKCPSLPTNFSLHVISSMTRSRLHQVRSDKLQARKREKTVLKAAGALSTPVQRGNRTLEPKQGRTEHVADWGEAVCSVNNVGAKCV